MNSSTGIARNHDLPSIARLFFDIESTWKNGGSLQQRSPPLGRGQACGLRGIRFRLAQSRTCRRHRPSQGIRRIGVRRGNWLTADQGRSLLLNSQGDSLRSRRNYAILALLIGCGLRRGELLALTAGSIQLREDHWVIADLHGKAGHIRTVPIPVWVKEALNQWTQASGIKDGCLFRAINKSGQIWGHGMTPKVLWEIVKRAAEAAGIDKLAPHDLRRTCARLCHLAGGELDQIQFLLGHVSIQTTEQYLGCKQKLRFAVNDKIGIEP
jgi:integrase